MTDEQLALEIAKGIIQTGVEGSFDSVSCSTAGDYPSMGVSQWEGLNGRGDTLLSYIDGGSRFIGRTYSDIRNSCQLQTLRCLLGTPQGQAAQLDILTNDCLNSYVPILKTIPTLDDSRCFIYAGIWCPTSEHVVRTFLRNRASKYNLRSLETLAALFQRQYWIAADVGDIYQQGYANRALNTYNYVAGVDLSTDYNVPAYGYAGNGR